MEMPRSDLIGDAWADGSPVKAAVNTRNGLKSGSASQNAPPTALPGGLWSRRITPPAHRDPAPRVELCKYFYRICINV